MHNDSLQQVEWWTPREVANLLRYDVSTIVRWCQAKKIDAAQMPGGTWRINKAVVEKIQQSGLPEERRRQTSKASPEWEACNDYFEESSKPKVRA
jgi:excisionase family DNA binding protein